MSTITIYKRTATGIGIVKRIGGDIPGAAPEVSRPVVDAIRETTRETMRNAKRAAPGRYAGLNIDQVENVINSAKSWNIDDIRFVANIFFYSEGPERMVMNKLLEEKKITLDLTDQETLGLFEHNTGETVNRVIDEGYWKEQKFIITGFEAKNTISIFVSYDGFGIEGEPENKHDKWGIGEFSDTLDMVNETGDYKVQ